ncbi:glycoside hydrolase family 5 protein [Rhodotorula graminis WP1]|uniref:Glycoside hydrolase family 5 protein n=1 Tax=Rhodotorula graminis (strain WP1) TaxID=578459 RepID=A0A194S950_RHOGW|nr:glycoside hydrolase family 5 protein [Rhodotorula graminis WP1]KPV75926.1 glycoside hydrolase family 5 protein [Rhodotorula graminis WP1]
MGPVPTTSPVTGKPVPAHWVHSSSAHFRLTDGRTLLLRGINLSSSAKTPRGQPGYQLDGFWEGAREERDVSFVGRILELDEADEHLERLKRWGFNCLRIVTTWEAIEHAGPGKYDQAYLDYVVELLRKCKQFGFRCYIDPHQDLWSRFSGGSGAPYWTLLACGLEPQNFTRTRAAVIESEWPDAASPDPAAFPPMIWATNYQRLACSTIFTMFFAGRDYAPKCIIDGINVQDFLQSHYLAAMRQLGEAISAAGDLLDECVIGWDSLNEPNPGFLGTADLDKHSKESVLRVGPTPTGFEALRLGMGDKLTVENWKSGPLGPARDGSVTVDPQGTVAWLSPDAEPDGKSPWGWTRDPGWKLGTCIWAQHGVWDVESRTLLRPGYFDECHGAVAAASGPEREVDFGADYWLPHWRSYARMVREVHPEAIHFIHSPVFQIPPTIAGPEVGNRAAHSSHFYDGLTLVTKHWNWFNADAIGILRGKYASIVLGVKVGESAIRRCMRSQLGVLRQDCFDKLGQYPTMMGEIGIPYDLDKKKAYEDGNYATQVRALDASLNACDGANVLNYTVWCYCPDNSHKWGDKWNGEDLSVWSPDDAVQMASSQTTAARRARQLGNVNHDQVKGIHAKGSTSSSTSEGDSGTVTPVDDPLHPINLNDGARALPAFVRPFPVKTVGTPTSIDFEIKSSKFKLEVRVDADDVADPDLATEIYIPLAQYAAHPQKVSYHVRAAAKMHHPGSKIKHPKSGDVQLALDGEGEVDGSEGEQDGAPHDLALKVKLSTGRYELDHENQTLKWYYPRPTSGSVVVKLELERVGGAVPLWKAQWLRSGWERMEEKNWQGNTCALLGVSLLGAAGVATAFMRS